MRHKRNAKPQVLAIAG